MIVMRVVVMIVMVVMVVMVVVVVVMMMVMVLSQHQGLLLGGDIGRRALILCPQKARRIWNRLQQLGEGPRGLQRASRSYG
jgi:hypothetical protein